MTVDQIIWTDKMQSVMNDEAQVLFLVGATGCSKSLVAGIKFMDWIHNAPSDETQFYMIFRDIGTGKRNFLDNKDTFYNVFAFNREQARDNPVGGMQFIWHGKYGEKVVYIVGANDKTAWTKVLGSNPDGIWLEELSVLHIDLIRECMGRTISRKCKLIGTTNGGMPTQEFYTEFVNHAVVNYKDTVPSAELAEIVEDKPYMSYYHFNLNDDAPHLTQEDRDKLLELYPEGSFYYNSKILGVRGFVEGAAYAQLMNKETHLVPFEDIELGNLEEIGLFVDVGSNKDTSDTIKASTIASLIGYSKDCQRIIVLESWVVPADSHDAIIKFCEDKIEWWWARYMQKFRKIRIDNADAILVNTWKAKNRFKTIDVGGCVKGYKNIITLVTRCTLKQQLLLQERLLWSTHAINCYNAHTRILLDEDGAELDMAIQDNDYGDTVAYGLTENWNKITKNDKRSY